MENIFISNMSICYTNDNSEIICCLFIDTDVGY